MLHEPDHFGERNDPNPPVNLLEMGESLLKWVLVGMGVILVLSGLLLSLSVFSFVKDVIVAPEDQLGTYFDGWERVLQSPTSEEMPAPVETQVPAEATIPVPVESPDTETATEEAAVPVPAAHPIAKSAQRQKNTPRSTTKSVSGNVFMDLANKLLDTITDGHIARPIGAVFILLLTVLLIKIPLYLIKMGIHIFSMLIAWQKGDKQPALPKK